MQQNFCLVLEGVLKYEQRERGVIIALLVITLIASAVIFLLRYPKMKPVTKVLACAIIVLFIVIFVAYIVCNNNYQSRIIADINNSSFVTYCGEFVHDNYQKDSFYHNVYIFDSHGKEILLRYPDYGNMYGLYSDSKEFPTGSFGGEVVYSKDSGIVVDWRIDKELQ